MEDYYSILGVSKGASDAEIKRAYRKLAQKHHPDLAEDKETAKTEFQKLQNAYDVLKDEDKRHQYDQFGPGFDKMGGGSPFGGGGQQMDFSQFFGGGSPSGGGFNFGDMFGGGSPMGGGGRGRQPSPGQNVNLSVTVPFSVAVLGGETSVTVQRSNKPQTITVKVPKGIESGKKIRLKNQGEPSPNRGPAGDLLLEIQVAAHPFYTRQRDNLLVTLPITLQEAVVGAKVEVPTPTGTVVVTVPPGTKNGKKLRLRGLGIDANSGKGDLVVELSLTIPTEMDQQALDLIQSLAENWADFEPRGELSW